MANQNSKFQRGTGSFKCSACGRMTRLTGVQSIGSDLCPQDYELAGIYNVLQDEGPEGLAEYAAEIRQHAEEIVAKGGKLDGDVEEMLDIVNAPAEPEPAPAPQPPTNEEIIASLRELAFLAETVAHLTGREAHFLPPADRARALLARLEG